MGEGLVGSSIGSSDFRSGCYPVYVGACMTELICPNCGEKTLVKGKFAYPRPRNVSALSNWLLGYLCLSSDCHSFYPEDNWEVKEANP